MKRTLLVTLLGILTLQSANSQKISNLEVFQENNMAVIMYDLLSIDDSKEFYVKVYCSADEGKTFGPMLTQVKGDANAIVKPGQRKRVIWDVLKESSSAKGDFVFRIDAMSVGPKGVLPTVDDGKGTTVQFLDIARSGKDVSLVMSISNKTQLQAQIILANFLVVDDNDKIYREFSGDVNKPIQLSPGEKKVATVSVKNVNPNSKSFSQLDFNASTVIVRLKTVPILNAEN